MEMTNILDSQIFHIVAVEYPQPGEGLRIDCVTRIDFQKGIDLAYLVVACRPPGHAKEVYHFNLQDIKSWAFQPHPNDYVSKAEKATAEKEAQTVREAEEKLKEMGMQNSVSPKSVASFSFRPPFTSDVFIVEVKGGILPMRKKYAAMLENIFTALLN